MAQVNVTVHPGDRKAVGHYRLIFPAQAASNAGAAVEIAPSLPIQRAIRKVDGRQVIAPDWERIGDAHVLVFQRLSNPEVVALIPALQAGGRAVVVDVDDDLSRVDPRNRAAGWENAANVLRACQAADLVTVATPALGKRYGAHGRVIVLENRVPGSVLSLPDRRDPEWRTVGWGGWAATHPGDLRVTHGGVQDALDRAPGSRFLQIGPSDGVRDQLGLRDPLEATGATASLDDYHVALGRLDVGIAPLLHTQFNQAKSWLKPLEYLARGAPFVASPLPEYERLAELTGGGLIASDRARNWRQALVKLVTDDGLRADMAATGRAYVAEHLTYETAGGEWATAWAQAISNRRAARKPALVA
jgi:glycosyltransferase involved in cell wall biosynthesis